MARKDDRKKKPTARWGWKAADAVRRVRLTPEQKVAFGMSRTSSDPIPYPVFSEAEAAQLGALVPADRRCDFVRSLRVAARTFFERHEVEARKPTPAEIRAALRTIAREVAALSHSLSLLDSETHSFVSVADQANGHDGGIVQHSAQVLARLDAAVERAARVPLPANRPRSSARALLRMTIAKLLVDHGSRGSADRVTEICRIIEGAVRNLDKYPVIR